MLLTEHEGKKLFTKAGITLPNSSYAPTATALKEALGHVSSPVFVKAQVLFGNRALQGLVKQAKTKKEALAIGKAFFNQDAVMGVLFEERCDFDHTFYLSLTYSTRSRQLVAQFSEEGGVGMDERGESIQLVPLSVTQEPQAFEPVPALLPLVQKLWRVFLENDAVLVEVNPLVRKGNAFICLDAKVELEDTAAFRHPEWEDYSERSGMGRPPTERERRAHAVSHQDHRGVAGESFFEFPGGEIGVLASGGGASTLAMDALMAAGLKPANYTEYSGNPTREKVRDLTEVVLSIPRLKALYVAGSNANFTDIYETLAGVIDGFLDSKYAKKGEDFVILIRRGGPRWKEAFTMVEERLKPTKVRYSLFGPEYPLVETAAALQRLLATNKKK